MYGPWEELVWHRARCEWATVLPPSFPSTLCSLGGRSDRPRLLKRRPDIETACVDSARALALLPGFFGFAGTSALQDVKRSNEGASEHTYLANGADRPDPNPESFAAQEFGRREGWRRRTKGNNISAQSVAFLPPRSRLKTQIETGSRRS